MAKFDAAGRPQILYDHATKEVLARARRGVFTVKDVFVIDELKRRGYPEIPDAKPKKPEGKGDSNGEAKV